MLNLHINLRKLKHNAKRLKKSLDDVKMVYVSKAYNSDFVILKHLKADFIADTNIKNLKKIPSYITKLLLRAPSSSDIKSTVKHSDISVNTELKTILKLDKKAKSLNKIHKILLMLDVGDLREGYFVDKKLFKDVKIIKKLKHIKVYGIGTNLTCYGGVLPSVDNLSYLVKVAKKIQKILGYKIQISGGNSSSLKLVFDDVLPKQITNIRIGEAMLNGINTYDNSNIQGLYDDCFYIKAKVIEIKQKPSVPIGKIGFDAFKNKPEFKDSGEIKRAILNIGKASIDINNIFFKDKNIKVLGASSDHLIIDVSTADVKLHDKIKIYLGYSSILRAYNSSYIKKKYIFK